MSPRGPGRAILKKGGMSPRVSGPPPTEPPPKPSDAGRSARPRAYWPRQESYKFTIHQDLRRFRLFPFWATGTLGIGHIGDPGGGVWRARSRKGLMIKITKWATMDALSRGRLAPVIHFIDAE